MLHQVVQHIIFRNVFEFKVCYLSTLILSSFFVFFSRFFPLPPLSSMQYNSFAHECSSCLNCWMCMWNMLSQLAKLAPKDLLFCLFLDIIWNIHGFVSLPWEWRRSFLSWLIQQLALGSGEDHFFEDVTLTRIKISKKTANYDYKQFIVRKNVCCYVTTPRLD